MRESSSQPLASLDWQRHGPKHHMLEAYLAVVKRLGKGMTSEEVDDGAVEAAIGITWVVNGSITTALWVPWLQRRSQPSTDTVALVSSTNAGLSNRFMFPYVSAGAQSIAASAWLVFTLRNALVV